MGSLGIIRNIFDRLLERVAGRRRRRRLSRRWWWWWWWLNFSTDSMGPYAPKHQNNTYPKPSSALMNKFSDKLECVAPWVGSIARQVNEMSWEAAWEGLSSIVWSGWFSKTKISWFEAGESKNLRWSIALQKRFEVEFPWSSESEGRYCWHMFRMTLR